jgi:hypothetical protein
VSTPYIDGTGLFTMPTALLGLPTELLNNILCLVDLEDVPRLFLVSRGLNAFVKDNQTLFRMIYTRLFVCFLADLPSPGLIPRFH